MLLSLSSRSQAFLTYQEFVMIYLQFFTPDDFLHWKQVSASILPYEVATEWCGGALPNYISQVCSKLNCLFYYYNN